MALLRFAAEVFMAIVFAGWMIVWIMRPTRTWTANFWNQVLRRDSTKTYGDTGAYILIYFSPIVLVAFIGAIYLSYTKRKNSKITRRPYKINPWNYPVFVKGPLALISLSELLLLGAFVTLFAWTTSKHLKNSFDRINLPSMHGHDGHMAMWEKKFNIVGGRLGAAGAVPFAFLFFPVARFSSLFHLINIPFEHAIRYHIWIGHIMMGIWSAHGLVYVIYWPIAHKSNEFILWEKTSIAGSTGMFAWIIGLIIWATSLNRIRKHRFELFFYTHQLYVLFVIGFVLHVGEKWLAMMVAGIFLFIIDRLFRFLQSRRHVEIVAARMVSSETMELTFAKLPNLNYPAASVIFLNLPSVSLLQWHPFTVTSCSEVEIDKLSIIIKCSGKWTQKLKELIIEEGYRSVAGTSGPSHFEAVVEGPHGHNIDYLHMYKNYIFLAGGSGIAPFLSIIKDLLYKVQTKQRTPPESILLVWAIRKPDELNILKTISLQSICPDFVQGLNIDVQAYVTGQDIEGKNNQEQSVITSEGSDKKLDLVKFAGRATTGSIHAEPSPTRDISKIRQHVRGISATKGYKLYALTILTSFLGYMLLAGTIHRHYIYPKDHNTYQYFSRSGRGLLSLLEYFAAVVFVGGASILTWNWWNRKDVNIIEAPYICPMSAEDGLKPDKIEYGTRPDFKEIIPQYVKGQKEYIGVFACGPEKMQESIGVLCQAHRLSFHPLNFEL